MNVNRKHAGSWRRYALGAGAVAALLTTAACGSASASDGSKPSDQQSTTTSASATTSSSPVKPVTAPPSKKPTGDSSVDLCTMADLTFTVTNYDARGEEVRHLMLVATNKSAKKCDVQNYPEVTLGNAKSYAPVKEGTNPDAAVTLAPGEKAYAGVLATGGQMDTYPVKFMTVGLGSPGGEAEAEKPVRVKMPVTSFEADDGQRVTYWAGTEGLAMRPVTEP
ncbi:DUF4232 domain-containing protein [Kribbella sp. VKM Ac-2566]|uniref:DUF4232 domain-containing protein n=1 Tax=Kribbella sp. VKM Ac-2566 TaxID=2512218 RepID=UPI0010630846|nr:DUF4232 domain-containing protein [Kribbella sp. VKM Ac-2566]TDW92015.1 uncharacterized protein DUF4232 [Kribbella sp. VKM Ac-2566]